MGPYFIGTMFVLSFIVILASFFVGHNPKTLVSEDGNTVISKTIDRENGVIIYTSPDGHISTVKIKE
jgi:hypothetical protein